MNKFKESLKIFGPGIAYAVSGALFMPFLAGTLLYLNNKSTLVGNLKNQWFVNLLLASAVVLFGVLAGFEIIGRF